MKQTAELEASTNPFDNDLNELEQDGFITDGLDLAHDYFRQQGEPVPGVRTERLEKIFPEHDVERWVLPNMMGVDGDIKAIRPEPLETPGITYAPDYGYATDERLFLPVPQGRVYRMPLRERPYAYALLSVCSTFVGYTDSNMYVSHVSYSFRDQTEATLNFMAQAGVRLENLYVVASLGEKGESWRSELEPSYTTVDEYVQKGVLPQNMLTFSPAYDEQGRQNNAEVVANEYGIRLGQSPYVPRQPNLGQLSDRLGEEQSHEYLLRQS